MAHQHEIREAYDITSDKGLCPDELRQSIGELGPQLVRLTNRLLDCMSIALGKNCSKKWLIDVTIFQNISLSKVWMQITYEIVINLCLPGPRRTERFYGP